MPIAFLPVLPAPRRPLGSTKLRVPLLIQEDRASAAFEKETVFFLSSYFPNLILPLSKFSPQ